MGKQTTEQESGSYGVSDRQWNIQLSESTIEIWEGMKNIASPQTKTQTTGGKTRACHRMTSVKSTAGLMEILACDFGLHHELSHVVLERLGTESDWCVVGVHGLP